MENNLYQYIEKNALISPNHIAINYQNNKVTYSAFLKNIDLFVDYFSYNLKIKKGERVAILVFNRMEFLSLFYACAKLGIILVPIPIISSSGFFLISLLLFVLWVPIANL